MKRLAWFIGLLLYFSMLISCTQQTQTPATSDETINPGDELDGMVFTTIDEIDWDISLSFLCDMENIEETETTPTVACFASPGDSIFFGTCNGVLYNTQDEIDDLWPKFKMDVIFDGQLVNLPPFGYLDTDIFDVDEKYVRIWNLLIENITPGTHTIECKYELEDESATYIYHFSVSEEPDTFPTLSAESPHRLNPYSSEKANLDYLLYIPNEHGNDPDRKWPLLLYLHGGDRVNKSVKVLGNVYPLSTLGDQDYFPFIVVAPQGTGEYEFWATDEMVSSIMILLDEVQGALSVDPKRIYLTGESGGGNGTWEIGVRHPERFAALASMSGYYGWPPTVPENICDLANVPVWAFHGAEDEIIPLEAEQSLVDALIACGGDVQFTIFPDIGHDLNAERVYTSELYTWLLSQSLK